MENITTLEEEKRELKEIIRAEFEELSDCIEREFNESEY